MTEKALGARFTLTQMRKKPGGGRRERVKDALNGLATEEACGLHFLLAWLWKNFYKADQEGNIILTLVGGQKKDCLAAKILGSRFPE